MTEQQAAETLTLDPSIVYALEDERFRGARRAGFRQGSSAPLCDAARRARGRGPGCIRALQAADGRADAGAEVAPGHVARARPRRSGPGCLAAWSHFSWQRWSTAYVAEKGLPWLGGEVAAEGSDRPRGAAGHAGCPTTTPATSASSCPAAARVTPAASGGADDANLRRPVGGRGASATTAGTVPPSAAVMAPGQVRLQLRFSGDSWVEDIRRLGPRRALRPRQGRHRAHADRQRAAERHAR